MPMQPNGPTGTTVTIGEGMQCFVFDVLDPRIAFTVDDCLQSGSYLWPARRRNVCANPHTRHMRSVPQARIRL